MSERTRSPGAGDGEAKPEDGATRPGGVAPGIGEAVPGEDVPGAGATAKPGAGATAKPDADRAKAAPEEVGGRGGLDPTRYGDWEIKGRCIDF